MLKYQPDRKFQLKIFRLEKLKNQSEYFPGFLKIGDQIYFSTDRKSYEKLLQIELKNTEIKNGGWSEQVICY